MANFAQVVDGAVHNVYRGVVGDKTIAFPVIADQLVECGDEVMPGWLFIDGAFVAPEVVRPPETVTQKRRHALFDALRSDKSDDEITVLGAVVNVLLAQLAVSVAPGARTPEFSDLLTKVGGVQAKFPRA